MVLAKIEEAVCDIRAGRMVIVVDSEDRENEGDLTCAAEMITPEIINFMSRYGRGLICAPLSGDIFAHFNIPPMVPRGHNTSKNGTNFGVSVGAAEGVSTGISAHDRARTIQVLADPSGKPEDLTMPGHIFPLLAQDRGVLERPGHTEAAVDLARLAGLKPAGVICEILKPDGTMARLPDLRKFAAEHDLKIVSIEALTAWRLQREAIVERIESTRIPTSFGEFNAFAYRDHQGLEHLAMCMGDLSGAPVLARLHSACLTGDVFGSNRCDCGAQLELAMARVRSEGRGVIVYLAQEGRGIGLGNKIRAYKLQEAGLDTVDANRQLGFADDCRTYDLGAAILKDLGVHAVELMTNNPNKVDELERCGVKVTRRLEHHVGSHEENSSYLKTKAERMGHILSI